MENFIQKKWNSSEKLRGIVKAAGTALIVIVFVAAWSIGRILHSISDSGKLQIVFAVIIGLMIMLLLFYCWRTYISKGETPVHVYFAIAGLTWGVIYTLVFIPFEAPDEAIHFMSANRTANQLMGREVCDEYGRVYVRESENREMIQLAGNLGKDRMVDFYGEIDEAADGTYVAYEYASRSSNLPIMYFPQALGIVAGRLLRVNYFTLLFSGRLANLLVYVLLTTFAIKAIPAGKWFLFVLSQFPMVLEATSSFSYDTITLAGCFLYIALALKWIYGGERITIWKLLFHLALGMVVASTKAVYVPAIGIIFLLPIENVTLKSKKSFRMYKGLCVLAGLAALLLVNMGSAKSLISRMVSDNTATHEVTQEERSEVTEVSAEADGTTITEKKEFYSLRDIKKFPVVLVNTLIQRAGKYLSDMVGAGFRWMEIEENSCVLIAFVILIVFSLMEETNVLISRKQRVWYAILFCGVVLAIFALFFFAETTTSETLIRGVQGRYFLPVLPLLIGVFLQGKYKLNNKLNPSWYLFGTLLCNIIVILTSFETIVKR